MTQTSTPRIRAATALLALLTVSAATSAQTTWVVDDDGGVGVDFTDIQAAIDSAAPADLVVVRDGTYAGFTLDFGLRIVADTGHAPEVGGPGIDIGTVPANQYVVLSGIDVEQAALYVHDNTGSVLLDDGTFRGAVGLSELVLVDNAAVVISRSTVSGRSGNEWSPGVPSYSARSAVEAVRSTVVISGSTVSGGRGATQYKSDGLPGATAIDATDSDVFVQTSTVQGGSGGDYWGPDPFEFDCDGGDGAPAMQLDGCTVVITGRGTDVVRGGDTGTPSWLGSPGVPAPTIVTDSSTIRYSGPALLTYGGAPVLDATATLFTAYPFAVPAFSVGGDTLLGGSLTIDLDSAPDALFAILVSPLPGVAPVGAPPTYLLLDPGVFTVPLIATTDGAGSFDAALGVPADPSLQGIPVHSQAFVQLPGRDVLSTSASFVLR